MSYPHRLLVHVEGHTEKAFVDGVLAPHLQRAGYQRVGARLLGDARRHSFSGGIRPWRQVRRQILNGLKDDPGSIATTMVDFYGLPQKDGWIEPNPRSLSNLSAVERVKNIEAAMLGSIAAGIGEHQASECFVPFVVVHEYEGLLFSDCTTLAATITEKPEENYKLASQLCEILDNAGGNPECINELPNSFPSKQLRRLVPDYDKWVDGVIAAKNIGLPRIRAACPHFDDWAGRLEQRLD